MLHPPAQLTFNPTPPTRQDALLSLERQGALYSIDQLLTLPGGKDKREVL